MVLYSSLKMWFRPFAATWHRPSHLPHSLPCPIETLYRRRYPASRGCWCGWRTGRLIPGGHGRSSELFLPPLAAVFFFIRTLKKWNKLILLQVLYYCAIDVFMVQHLTVQQLLFISQFSFYFSLQYLRKNKQTWKQNKYIYIKYKDNDFLSITFHFISPYNTYMKVSIQEK